MSHSQQQPSWQGNHQLPSVQATQLNLNQQLPPLDHLARRLQRPVDFWPPSHAQSKQCLFKLTVEQQNKEVGAA